jgi:hypothetical protein
MQQRTCLNCGETLKGRIDKKYCDDQCRTQYNNRINSDSLALIKNVNTILKKNRRILEELLSHTQEGKLKVNIKRLQQKGYNFIYHTHRYKTQAGSIYHFCYEYGYLHLEQDTYVLVKNRMQEQAAM